MQLRCAYFMLGLSISCIHTKCDS